MGGKRRGQGEDTPPHACLLLGVANCHTHLYPPVGRRRCLLLGCLPRRTLGQVLLMALALHMRNDSGEATAEVSPPPPGSRMSVAACCVAHKGWPHSVHTLCCQQPSCIRHRGPACMQPLSWPCLGVRQVVALIGVQRQTQAALDLRAAPHRQAPCRGGHAHERPPRQAHSAPPATERKQSVQGPSNTLAPAALRCQPPFMCAVAPPTPPTGRRQVLLPYLAQVVTHVVGVLGQINGLQCQAPQPFSPVDSLGMERARGWKRGWLAAQAASQPMHARPRSAPPAVRRPRLLSPPSRHGLCLGNSWLLMCGAKGPDDGHCGPDQTGRLLRTGTCALPFAGCAAAITAARWWRRRRNGCRSVAQVWPAIAGGARCCSFATRNDHTRFISRWPATVQFPSEPRFPPHAQRPTSPSSPRRCHSPLTAARPAMRSCRSGHPRLSWYALPPTCWTPGRQAGVALHRRRAQRRTPRRPGRPRQHALVGRRPAPPCPPPHCFLSSSCSSPLPAICSQMSLPPTNSPATYSCGASSTRGRRMQGASTCWCITGLGHAQKPLPPPSAEPPPQSPAQPPTWGMVGQALYVLMASRSPGLWKSSSTLTTWDPGRMGGAISRAGQRVGAQRRQVGRGGGGHQRKQC